MTPTTDPTAKPLPEGIGIQVYRGALRVRGDATRYDAFARACGRFAAAGCRFVVWHGFSTELTPDHFGALATLASKEGLASWAAYGMDSDDMKGKGERIGAVARMPECRGVFTDLEGRGEDEPAPIEAAHYRDFRLALRKAAPDAVVIAQTWEIPQSHKGMPWDEMSACSDAFAPMEYLNNWKRTYGTARAAKMEPRWAGGRDWLRARIKRPDVAIFRTTHAVGWEDIPGDRDAMLRAHAGRLVVWSEPSPSAEFLAAIKRAVAANPIPPKVPA